LLYTLLLLHYVLKIYTLRRVCKYKIKKKRKNIKKSNPKFTTYTLSISEYRFLEELLGHTLYYYSILKNGRNECFTKKTTYNKNFKKSKTPPFPLL